jgi:hypothetical protein
LTRKHLGILESESIILERGVTLQRPRSLVRLLFMTTPKRIQTRLCTKILFNVGDSDNDLRLACRPIALDYELLHKPFKPDLKMNKEDVKSILEDLLMREKEQKQMDEEEEKKEKEKEKKQKQMDEEEEKKKVKG